MNILDLPLELQYEVFDIPLKHIGHLNRHICYIYCDIDYKIYNTTNEIECDFCVKQKTVIMESFNIDLIKYYKSIREFLNLIFNYKQTFQNMELIKYCLPNTKTDHRIILFSQFDTLYKYGNNILDIIKMYIKHITINFDIKCDDENTYHHVKKSLYCISEYAARNGNIEILKYLKLNKIRWCKDIIKYSLETSFNNVKLIKYLIKNDEYLTMNVIHFASSNINNLKFVHRYYKLHSIHKAWRYSNTRFNEAFKRLR